MRKETQGSDASEAEEVMTFAQKPDFSGILRIARLGDFERVKLYANQDELDADDAAFRIAAWKGYARLKG